MLNEVLEVLRHQGWADLDQPYEKTIYLSQGASLWFILSRSGTPESFVKFSRLVSLKTEAERCALASSAFPDHAPRFIGYREQDGLHVLASKAEKFRAVTASMTESKSDARAVREGLVAYFRQQGRQAQFLNPGQARDGLERIESYFAQHELAESARHVWARVRARLFDLPLTNQHGDLVLNNLGLRPSGGLITFDWEDFGAVALPGLDLFTLEYSFAHEASLARERGQQSRPERFLDLEACCAAQGLSLAEYQELRLAHALAFLYIKRNYGAEIQSRLRAYIASLTA